MAKPLVLDLHIPYCIRPENYLAHFNAVGSNAEINAYMDALKREVLSYEGELDGYEIRAVHLSGGSASVMAPDLLGDVLRWGEMAEVVGPVDLRKKWKLKIRKMCEGIRD